MKNKISKVRKINIILDDYDNILNDYKLSQSDEIKEQINSLQEEATTAIKQNKKADKEFSFFTLLLLLLFIFSIIFIFLMSKENENLKNDNIEKTNIINKLQWTDSLFNQIMNIQYDSLETETGYISRSVSYRIKNGEIVKYNELVDKNDELEKERDILQRKLNLVLKNYNITFVETDRSITIHAEQIDSALLLLPHYKDKLKYDPKEKSWIITLPKND